MAEGSLFFVGRREGDGSDPLCCNRDATLHWPRWTTLSCRLFRIPFPVCSSSSRPVYRHARPRKPPRCALTKQDKWVFLEPARIANLIPRDNPW